MSTEEAAAYLGLTTGRIRQLARAGELEGEHIGRAWIFTREEVKRYAAAQRPRRGRPRKGQP